MTEFDPRTDSPKERIDRFAAWLVKCRVRLGAREPEILAITRVVIDDYDNHGTWHMPLKGSVDLIDEVDERFAAKSPLGIWVTGMTDDKPPEVEVSYHAIDDETREAKVDLDSQPVFVPNN